MSYDLILHDLIFHFMKSYVPQDSILGPLLFVLFINDLFFYASEGTNISLYADDTKILREIFSFSEHHIIQNDIIT